MDQKKLEIRVTELSAIVNQQSDYLAQVLGLLKEMKQQHP